MERSVNEYIEANRKHWNEVAPIHTGAISYDVPGFKAGKSSLNSVELDELGDVQGKTLLQLQCQFGLETLSWAREGAVVTGIDFSASAIDYARALAEECDIPGRFLVSDVYDLPDNLDGQFDIVLTSYGVLWWLPDLTRWAQIASSFVRPGGTFYIAEFHPFAHVFDDAPDVDDLYVKYPYFSPDQPLRFDLDHAYAYAGPPVKLQNGTTYRWPHGVGEVVTALIEAGLRIEFLHEFPFGYTTVPFKERVEGWMFRLTKHDGSVPLLYSIRATKPA